MAGIVNFERFADYRGIDTGHWNAGEMLGAEDRAKKLSNHYQENFIVSFGYNGRGGAIICGNLLYAHNLHDALKDKFPGSFVQTHMIR